MIRSFLYGTLFTLASLALSTPAQSREPSHHTAEDMYHLYNDTSKDCGASDRPAFLCSGVIIRAATSGATWNSWDVSPEDAKLGGVSFSYLRKDIPYNDFETGIGASGITIFPLFGPYNAPAKKHVMQVMCAFPLDGWTDDRNMEGCGADSKYGTPSGACQPQGIMTADQWVKHYQAAPTGNGSNPNRWQCGFDVQTGSKYNTADAFMQSLLARNQIGNAQLFKEHNELRIASWSNVAPADLPIQSFFYSIAQGGANAKGLADAQLNQKAYFAKTQIFIPIVQISAPASVNDSYGFKVVASDQAVPFPD